MYYHYPSIGGSAYALWKHLIRRKTSLRYIQIYRWKRINEGFAVNQLFTYVCMYGDLSSAIFLLHRSSYYQKKNEDLGIACNRGHFHIAKWLFYSKDYDPRAFDDLAMHMAILGGHLRIAKWLYSLYCDVPNHISKLYNCRRSFICASGDGHLRMIKWLYKIGYSPTYDDNAAIRMACDRGQLKVVKWLYKIGCDPTAKNNAAISWASEKGHLHVVKWLCKIGCDPAANNNNAINSAARSGQLHVVKWLRTQLCSSPDSTSGRVWLFPKTPDLTVFLWSSWSGQLHIMQWCYKIGVDPTFDNNHAIGLASEEGHKHIVKWLYSVGADPTVALREAKKRNNDDMIRFIYDMIQTDWVARIRCWFVRGHPIV